MILLGEISLPFQGLVPPVGWGKEWGEKVDNCVYSVADIAALPLLCLLLFRSGFQMLPHSLGACLNSEEGPVAPLHCIGP